jgi:hypothetical protein
MLRLEATLIRPQTMPSPFRHFGANRVSFEKIWARPVRGFSVPKKPKPKEIETVRISEEAQPVESVIVPVPSPEVRVPDPEPPNIVREPLPAPMPAKAFADALKKARKNASALRIGTTAMMRSAGEARPMLGASTRTAYRRASQKTPTPRKSSPPLEVTQELLCEIVKRAYRIFSSPRIRDPKQLIAVMLDPEGVQEDIDAFIVAHVIEKLYADIDEAKQRSVRVDRRFLHSKATRVFGRLTGEAWKRAQEASSMVSEDVQTVSHRLRRSGFEHAKDGCAGHDVLVWRNPQTGCVIYFLVELSARRSKRAIHEVWRRDGFHAWVGRRRVSRFTRH